MQNFDEKSANMHMGRLIQMLSHQMKRKNCIVTMIDGDSLTVMQKHILKFIKKILKKSFRSASLL